MSAPVRTSRTPHHSHRPTKSRSSSRRWLVVALLTLLAVALGVGAVLVLGDEPTPIEPVDEPSADDPVTTPEPTPAPDDEPDLDDPAPAPNDQPVAAPTEVGAGLPLAAEATAQQIHALAQRGDLDTLAELALAGQAPFTASFGEAVTTPAELVALWELIGRDEVVGALIALVELPDWYDLETTGPAGDATVLHVTPRFMHEPTEENRRILEEQLGAEAVESGIGGEGWIGWRLGITADGDWWFFVRGD